MLEIIHLGGQNMIKNDIIINICLDRSIKLQMSKWLKDGSGAFSVRHPGLGLTKGPSKWRLRRRVVAELTWLQIRQNKGTRHLFGTGSQRPPLQPPATSVQGCGAWDMNSNDQYCTMAPATECCQTTTHTTNYILTHLLVQRTYRRRLTKKMAVKLRSLQISATRGGKWSAWRAGQLIPRE